MLHFLLTLIAAWVLWKIARHEIERRRRARFVRESLRPGAGVALQGERLEQWRRAQEERQRQLLEEQAQRKRTQEDRICEILKTTPLLQRAAMRRWLEKRIELGYDV